MLLKTSLRFSLQDNIPNGVHSSKRTSAFVGTSQISAATLQHESWGDCKWFSRLQINFEELMDVFPFCATGNFWALFHIFSFALQIAVEEIGVNKLVQGEGLVKSKQPTHLMNKAVKIQVQLDRRRAMGVKMQVLEQSWMGEGLVKRKRETHLVSMAIKLNTVAWSRAANNDASNGISIKWVLYRLLTLPYPHPYTLNTSISSYGKKTGPEHRKPLPWCHCLMFRTIS